MSNEDKTRIVRPIEQLQRSALPKENDDDPTRKIDRDAQGDFPPVQAADEGKTRLFRPSPNKSADGATFNPLAPKSETQDASDDPVVGWLIVVKGPGRGNAVRLGYGWNSIGRDASQRVSLDYGDSSISRINHTKVLYDPRARKFTLTLGEGTNPTYVRGEALLGPTEIKSNDRLQVGDTELLFVALCGEDFDWQDNA
jgi:hypothetical protein